MRLAVHGDDDGLFAVTVIVGAVSKTKTDFGESVIQHVGFMCGAIHPASHSIRTRRKAVGQVFSGFVIGVSGILNEYPWFFTVGRDV